MRSFIVVVAVILTASCRHEYKGQLPAFDLLLMDSVTHLNTNSIDGGNPIALLYFSPDCEHCQAETETIIQHMDSLRNMQFYFITNDPLDRLRGFNIYYKLHKYKNITLCWDNQFFFARHFKGAFPPYMVVYDKEKRQQGVYEGGLKAEEMIALANKL